LCGKRSRHRRQLLSVPSTHGFKMRVLAGSQCSHLLLLLHAQACQLRFMLRCKPLEMGALLLDKVLEFLIESQPEGVERWAHGRHAWCFLTPGCYRRRTTPEP